MFVSELERQRAILEDGQCHHTVVWQRYCGKLTFRACIGPAQFQVMLAGVCVTWLHSEGNDRE